MKTTFKNYPIFKKREGQGFTEVSSIYAENFTKAKKQFAKQMTDDNFEQSNNIQWLTKEQDGVNETGFYDLNAGCLTYTEDGKVIDPNEADDFLMVTEKAIKKGFNYWNEDVYTWELRNVRN